MRFFLLLLLLATVATVIESSPLSSGPDGDGTGLMRRTRSSHGNCKRDEDCFKGQICEFRETANAMFCGRGK
ncbi:unnamed protein product, partial [Mesorhabditis spiculigera]